MTLRKSHALIVAIFWLMSASGFAQNYSLTNQQPVGRVPYAQNLNSVSTKQLPLDVMSHLAPSSDAIAVNVLQDNGGWGPLSWNSGFWGSATFSTPGPDNCCSMPLYYATASDPWYVITSCVDGGPLGIPFHAPSGAKFTLSNSDNFLDIWDQSQGYLLEFYQYKKPGLSLPACTATSASQACALSMYTCSMSSFDTSKDWGSHSASRSGGFKPFMGVIRMQELMQGQINHALYLSTDCVVGPAVFPDVPNQMAYPCGKGSTPGPANRPRQASLFFLDYTDQQIAAMNVPQWQKTVLTAFAHYGGYIGEAGGGGSTLNPYMESGEAFAFAGKTNPFVQWASSQPGLSHSCNSNDCRYYFKFLDSVPWVSGPGCPSSTCNLSHHLHVADPCVVAGLANQPSNAATPPCVWPVTVALAGSGAGSVSTNLKGGNGSSGGTLYLGSGITVTLTARPNSGSSFSGWTGACAGAGTTCAVRVSQATTATAVFH